MEGLMWSSSPDHLSSLNRHILLHYRLKFFNKDASDGQRYKGGRDEAALTSFIKKQLEPVAEEVFLNRRHL